MRIRRTGSIVIGVVLVAVLSACGSGHSASTQSALSTAQGREADVAFAQLMIPHHEQAVEMAEVALSRQASREVTALATTIKAAQDPEMAQMRGWLSTWGAPLEMTGPTADDGSMDHSGMDMGGMDSAGMMSAEDMAALAEATGTEFDRMWLTMMVAHHQGAVEMANQVQAATDDPQVKALADSIVAGQTAEIATMQQLLAG